MPGGIDADSIQPYCSEAIVKENENVATEALAYVPNSSSAARLGMMKLLRGFIRDLPLLNFETQQMKGTIRPDMWGLEGTKPRVFIENKFWAGLTENQPVSYLKQLAEDGRPSVLLVIGPADREPTLWRELMGQLGKNRLDSPSCTAPAGILRFVATELGPILALTSWTKVLSFLEDETIDDARARADLAQLRALCDAADDDAFVPVSAEECSDQRTPALILQLGSIVKKAVHDAVDAEVLNIRFETGRRGRLNETHSWDRIGRYVRISSEKGPGAWFGVHFGYWKSHGSTPLWLVFPNSDFGQATAVRQLIEPWAEENGVMIAANNLEFAIALDIATGEEEAGVVHSLVDDFRRIAEVLTTLPPKPSASEPPEVNDDVA